MQLIRITAQPQTVRDKSVVSVAAYLDEATAGVGVDFLLSSPIPSTNGQLVVSAVTDSNGIASTTFVMDAAKFGQVIQNAGSIGQDMPFDLGAAGSAKSISLMARGPSNAVSCALLYDVTGTLPEGGMVAGEGSISLEEGGIGQIVTTQTTPTQAPTGNGGSNPYILPIIALFVVAVIVIVLLKRRGR